MVITLAVVAWLGLGLAVALLVGAGANHPPPRPERRSVPPADSASRGRARRDRRVLYVVDRAHRDGRARRLVRAGPGLR